MTRECGRHPASNSCSSMELGDATATVCSCDTDACNSGSADIGASVSLAFLIGVTAVLISDTL